MMLLKPQMMLSHPQKRGSLSEQLRRKFSPILKNGGGTTSRTSSYHHDHQHHFRSQMYTYTYYPHKYITKKRRPSISLGRFACQLFCIMLLLNSRRRDLFLVLSAEIEGHHTRHDDHHIVGSDVTTQREDYENENHSQRDDRLDINQLREILEKIHDISPFVTPCGNAEDRSPSF